MDLQSNTRAREAFSAYVLLFATATLLTIASLAAYPVQVFRLAVSDSLLGIVILLFRNAVVWFFAYLGYARLATYAGELRETAEGKALSRIASAVGLFALSLALPGIVWRGIETFAPADAHTEITRRLLSTYLGAALAIAGFLLLSSGLRSLFRQAGIKGGIHRAPGLLIAAFAVIGAGFVYLMVSSFERYNPPFSLPVLLLTIVAPYCLAWVLGGLCLNSLRHYMHEVPGIIYRPMFQWLGRGLAVLIVMQIAVQWIEGSFAYMSGLPNSLAVAIILVLSVLQTASFALIALGAKQLDKLEKV